MNKFHQNTLKIDIPDVHKVWKDFQASFHINGAQNTIRKNISDADDKKLFRTYQFTTVLYTNVFLLFIKNVFIMLKHPQKELILINNLFSYSVEENW